MLIGVTGQIGSGKSTAATILRSLGAAIIDADKIGRKVVSENPALLKKLAGAFGKGIISPKGNLRRKTLARLAFASQESHNMLNALVHPYLLRELHRQIKLLSAKSEVVVIDAALLLDWGLDKIVDLTVLIHAPRKRRMKMLAKRGINIEDGKAREKQQLSLREYRSRADITISNAGDLKQLRAQIKRFWRSLELSPN